MKGNLLTSQNRRRLLRGGAALSLLTFCLFLREAEGYNKTEYCFGAVGPGCGGAPFASPVKLSGGKLRMKVSVGSIAHDTCCNLHPNGKWCSGVPSGLASDLKSRIGMTSDCDKEWNKAFWNSQPTDNRQWDYVFDPKEAANLAPVRNGRRTTFASNYQGGGTVQVQETVSTRKLAAPAGTNLDVGDQDFCASGRASAPKSSFGKSWITCL